MEDRATAAAAAAAAGEGGRDQEDASRKGLAPLWSQSNEERRALRSEYADVRAMIRDEVKDDPTLGQFDAALNKIEKLHEKVQGNWSKLLMLRLCWTLPMLWSLLPRWKTGMAAVSDILTVFAMLLFDDRNGPMGLGLAVKERRHTVRRRSGHLGSEPAEPDELAPDQDERNDTDENIAVMFNLLRSHSNRNVKLEHLILNRPSFAQTVENIFALSFLVKDGRTEIYVADNGDHFVAPRNAPSAASIASREVVNSQFVFRFDTEDWWIMKGMVNPGEELMPHRSSYHGGEYKTTTQSCSAPDCSELASDSEHPKEFTEDEEAMELDLVKCCSGDGGLKTRKRQHVARRLF
ncbi:unnamed protein product [Miscanthus lutarioriparius]|uniref:Non-structural maintenance of chromosomes element 4 n=1 Tax=Miscanthus lutarioriparius TaxID=422564 RepID=A0A811R3R6_9POAL|nr:unnamed protein product [Miscanthus lutarioriparius]